jgi:ribonuclease D
MKSRRSVQVARGDLPSGLAAAFACATRIAWDVETSGLDWRRDHLGTCQLFTAEVGPVVVSVDAGVPSRLVELLENPEVEKVFHHAPFDLRFMVYNWKVRPASIRCTKVASKLLTPSAANQEHGLQSLLLNHVDIRLSKGTVRTSDWTAANLTEAQIDYAAGDVIHLPQLLSVLMGKLEAEGLDKIYDDCCAFIPARVQLELCEYPDVFAY